VSVSFLSRENVARTRLSASISLGSSLVIERVSTHVTYAARSLERRGDVRRVSVDRLSHRATVFVPAQRLQERGLGAERLAGLATPLAQLSVNILRGLLARPVAPEGIVRA